MEELKNNHKNQIVPGKNGGARPGAGRPKGSGHKPKIADDLTEEQKKELIDKIYEKAMEGDSKLLQFLAEQIYGKAQQNIGMTDGDGNPFQLVIKRYGEEDNETTQISG